MALFSCILVAILSLIYTYLFYQDTGNILVDICKAVLPMGILVGLIGIIFIFRDNGELLDLRMVVVLWCIWGSACIGMLSAIKLNIPFIVMLILVLSLKVILLKFHEIMNRRKIK